MNQEIWYRHLAVVNRRIVEARWRIEGQQAQVSKLRQERRSARRATAALLKFEERLHLLNVHRASILEKVRLYQLPSYG
jgi:phage terminase Nu1 subunit (DNA packaging protein)